LSEAAIMLTKRNFLILLPAIAFVLMMLGGFVVSLLTLKAVPAKDWPELQALDKILSGESTRRFTKLLNQHFVLGKTFSEIERGTQWNLVGDLGPGVRAGCDDWLFLTDELELYADRKKSADFRANLAAQLNDKLRARGIQLLMVVVPDKTRIERQHLCGLARSAQFGPRITDWLAALNSKNVAALDLTAALTQATGERYYHTDTHWNEHGAEVSARVIAAELRARGWISGAATTDTSLFKATQIQRSGDLVHLAGLDNLPRALRPANELTTLTEVPPVAVVSEDLFGDAGLPSIALIGTSYSRNSNFVPFLSHHVGEPIANLAKDGGDFMGAASDYFSGATFRDNPPKVIIWEIPERVIAKPLSVEERKKTSIL